MAAPKGPWQMPGIQQSDRSAFAAAVLAVIRRHGDIASEACWQELSEVIVHYWLVFQADQSPMSTWNMVAKCTDTVLRIRSVAKTLQGESSQGALEEFRALMGEVLGDEAKEPSA